VEAHHVPAAAREFLKAGERLLRGGALDFGPIASELEAAASAFSRTIWKRENWLGAQELAGAGRHRAAVRILAFWEQELLPEQRAFLEKERQAALAEPVPIERGGKSDRDWFIARANHMTAKELQLKAAVKQAGNSADAAAAHRAASVEFHDAKDFLYDDLEQAISRSKRGDQEATEYLVTFLEADLWCFRSGYMKGRLYELLRRVNLDENLQTRLQSVLLTVVGVGYRMEFRSACRLARQIADPHLIADLKDRLRASPDPHTRRRALWMLWYMPNGLQQQDAPVVLEVVLDTAGDKDWHRVSAWVRRLCRRFADDAFASKIRTLAISSNKAKAPVGLRLLNCAIREPLDAGERSALEPIILDAVHERGPAVGLMEGLAALADTRRLRVRLAELAEHAHSPVNRYAQWALNSAIRANGKQTPDL
jgi:hypothetical protein